MVDHKITLYEHGDLTGITKEIYDSVNDIGDFKSILSGIKIDDPLNIIDKIILYEGINYTGTSMEVFSSITYSDFINVTNDRISSIKVVFKSGIIEPISNNNMWWYLLILILILLMVRG